MFTTREAVDLSGVLVFRKGDGQLEPFSEEKLLISLIESCRHRPNGIYDAAAIKQTAIEKVLAYTEGGIVPRERLIKIIATALHRFDKTAATIYAAYHN